MSPNLIRPLWPSCSLWRAKEVIIIPLRAIPSKTGELNNTNPSITTWAEQKRIYFNPTLQLTQFKTPSYGYGRYSCLSKLVAVDGICFDVLFYYSSSYTHSFLTSQSMWTMKRFHFIVLLKDTTYSAENFSSCISYACIRSPHIFYVQYTAWCAYRLSYFTSEIKHSCRRTKRRSKLLTQAEDLAVRYLSYPQID